MKRLTFVHGAAGLAVAAVPSLVGAQSKAPGTSSDIAVMLERHDTAMNNHDLDALVALFEPGSGTVIMGTGPGEKYQGESEIREAFQEFFKDFDKGTLTRTCYWKQGRTNGNVAWGAAMCKFSDSLGGKAREYELNVSAVLERKSGRWYFAMLHFSNIVGGAVQPS
jgi:ketosteroid isomerase-like protein